MKHTDEVTVILTPERIKLYERGRMIGLPSIVVSMYGDRIQKLIDDEREACIDIVARHGGSVEIEAAIRARGQA